MADPEEEDPFRKYLEGDEEEEEEPTEYAGLTDSQLLKAYKEGRISEDAVRAELAARGKSQNAINELVTANTSEKPQRSQTGEAGVLAERHPGTNAIFGGALERVDAITAAARAAQAGRGATAAAA